MKYYCLCLFVLLCSVAQGKLVSRFTMDNNTNTVTSTTLFEQPDNKPVNFESSDVVCGNASRFGGYYSISASKIEPLPLDFTISVWVKMSVVAGTRYGILSTRASSASGIPFWGVELSASGAIIFELSDNGIGNYIDPLAYSVNIPSFSNSWHHMVFTKLGTYGEMYFDGQLVSSGYRMKYNPIVNTKLMFGKDPIYASPSSMLVDEFRMYDAPVNGECLYYYPCANLPCPDQNGGSGTCPSAISGQYTKQCYSGQCKVTLTLSGATQPLFFQWNDGFSTYAPFRNISESLLNTLMVRAVDANNCTVTIPLNANPTPKPTPTPTASPSNMIKVIVDTYADSYYCNGTVIHSDSSVIQDNQCIFAAGVYVRYQFLSVSTPKVCIFTDSTCNTQPKCVHFPEGCQSNGDGTVTDTHWYRYK